jgi:hypothetical protein
MTVDKPIANWIDKHVQLRSALFSVPVIVLEPIKPIAGYLAATGQFLGGAVTFIFGELLKLVLVERLFGLTREKLMRIPAFARLYGWYSQAMAWLKATEAWRTLESLTRRGREYFKTTGALRIGFANIDKGSRHFPVGYRSSTASISRLASVLHLHEV